MSINSHILYIDCGSSKDTAIQHYWPDPSSYINAVYGSGVNDIIMLR